MLGNNPGRGNYSNYINRDLFSKTEEGWLVENFLGKKSDENIPIQLFGYTDLLLVFVWPVGQRLQYQYWTPAPLENAWVPLGSH